MAAPLYVTWTCDRCGESFLAAGSKLCKGCQAHAKKRKEIRRKATVTVKKRAAFVAAGTCEACGVSVVANGSKLCRRCRPVVEELREESAIAELEAEKATLHFRYWLTVRKKEASAIGELARAFLPDRSLRELRGLEAIAGATTDEIDIKTLEDAWAASEAERRVSEAS